jgi:hypothetical protein
MGIGSTAYIALGGPTSQNEAVNLPRNVIGFELKESYHKQALANCRLAKGRYTRREKQEKPLLAFDKPRRGPRQNSDEIHGSPPDHRPVSTATLPCGHPNSDENWSHNYGCVMCDCGAKQTPALATAAAASSNADFGDELDSI